VDGGVGGTWSGRGIDPPNDTVHALRAFHAKGVRGGPSPDGAIFKRPAPVGIVHRVPIEEAPGAARRAEVEWGRWFSTLTRRDGLQGRGGKKKK